MYGMPNLLRSAAASVSTLTYNSIYDPLNQDALNLFKNLETRATVDQLNPLVDFETKAGFKSCFVADTKINKGAYVFGIDHGYEVI